MLSAWFEEFRRERGGDKTTGYTASLSYFYRNPDLQMGEFKRLFQLQFEAKLWAAKHKGMRVPVHVNPRDPSDSVLLKSDLEGLTSIPELSVDRALFLEQLPQINGAWLLVSRFSALVAMSGILLTLVELENRRVEWIKFALIYMLIFNFVSTSLITYNLDDESGYQAIFRSSARFYPAWLRWGAILSGALLVILLVAGTFEDHLPLAVQHSLDAIGNFFPHLVAYWFFFTTGATHAVILRSQKQSRRASRSKLRRADDEEIRSTWWNES